MTRETGTIHRLVVAITIFSSLTLSLVLISCSAVRQVSAVVYGTNDYFRVESLSSLEDTAPAGNTQNGVELTYNAPFDKVWSAAEETAMLLDQLSTKTMGGVPVHYRAITSEDPTNGTIKCGNIVNPGDMGHLNGIGIAEDKNTYADEFTIKVQSLTPQQTKVTVKRRVVEGVPVRDQWGASFRDELQEKISSGNYERWFLTQIDDDLSGKVKRAAVAVASLQQSKSPNLSFTNPQLTVPTQQLAQTFMLLTPKLNDNLVESSFRNLNANSAAMIGKVLAAYRDSLMSDVKDALEANGVHLAGTVDDISQMTYPQKSTALMVLDCQISLSTSEIYDPNQQSAPRINESSVQDTLLPWVITGSLNVSGSIQMSLYEPFSYQKMWTKTITIPEATKRFTYKFTLAQHEYLGGQIDRNQLVYGEDERPSLLADILGSSYLNIAGQANTAFNYNDLNQAVGFALKLHSPK